MIRSTGRSSAVIFSFDSSTWICRRSPPSTLTDATPGTRSRRGDRSFSAISRSVTRSKLPSTPTPMIGWAFASNLNMTGASASSGRRPRTRSSRLRTSSAASLRSVPHAKFSVTRPEPSDEVDSSRSRPRDGAHRLLDRPRDQLLDLQRADAGIADANREARDRRRPASGRPAGAAATSCPSRMTTPESMNIVTGRWMAVRGMLIGRSLTCCPGALAAAAALTLSGGGHDAVAVLQRAGAGRDRLCAPSFSPDGSRCARRRGCRSRTGSEPALSRLRRCWPPAARGRRGARRAPGRPEPPTNTPVLPSSGSRRRCSGPSARSARDRDRQLHARIHAGLQPEAGIRHFDFHFRGARRRVEHRRDAAHPAGERLAGERIDFDLRAACPTGTRLTSFSTRFATIRTMRMSTTDATGTFGLTNAPGSRKRLPTKPSTGEAMTVFDRLIFSSSSRDFACSNCALREIELRERRLVARLGVVVGLLRQQLALEQALVALEVGLRQLQVRLALPDRRRATLDTTPRPAGPAPEFRGPRPWRSSGRGAPDRRACTSTAAAGR